MIVGGPNQSIEIRQATRAAFAPPRHRNGSDPEPFQRFLDEIYTHIDDPTELHRSMARVPVAFLFVAPVPPRNDRNCLAQRPFARHCSSGVEPPKAPGFLVSASR